MLNIISAAYGLDRSFVLFIIKICIIIVRFCNYKIKLYNIIFYFMIILQLDLIHFAIMFEFGYNYKFFIQPTKIKLVYKI